jgi:hypothetical protein
MNDSPEPDSTSTRKRRWRLAGILLCMLFVVMTVAAYFFLFHHPGIDVTVENTGSKPMRSVVLFVTGNSYNLGDIPANGTAHATVKCTGDSHLEIEFELDQEQSTRLDAGGFFQPGDRGTIRVSIKDGEIVDNEQNIEWHPA